MKKKYTILKLILFIQLLFVLINSNAQTGLNFQGVARTSNNVILASQPINLRLSILQGSASGITEYTETRKVTTNAQGLFSVVIGDTDASSTIGNFSTINWKNTPKYLKIEMDPAAGNNFITMGTTQFQYVAYAQFAKSVDAENITGVVPVARGGTGTISLSAFKTAMALDKVNNTADTEKPISAKTQTALDLKLNAEDTSKYAKQIWTDSALLTKINSLDTIKYVKKTYADSSLLTKLKITDTAAMLSDRIGKDTLNLSARINAKANTSDLTTSLALKENVSNKSSAADLGGLSPSDVLFPTQKAVKAYVTANASSGGVADGGITTIKLADGAVTDAKLGTGISKSKVGLGNVENIAISTWAGTSSLTTVGTITNGTWSGTAISLNNGGTGATTAADARTNLGLVIGTNVQAPLTAGVDYLAPTGTAAGLTNFPTLNQNTSGNAATATLASAATIAGNITATSNTTLTSLSNLVTVGTITSGTWSGTVIDVAHGGTGTSTATTNTFFAGPNGSNGAPNFRTINIADIPDLSSTYILNNGTANFSSDITVSGQEIGIGGDRNQGHLNLLFGKQALSGLAISVDNYNQTMNTAIGPYSQVYSGESNKNTSVGTFSLSGLGDGDNNTAIGAYAFTENNVDEKFGGYFRPNNGSNNTSIGAFALSYPSTNRNTTYSTFNHNTAIGAYALSGLTFNIISDTSNRNTVIGYKAGSNLLKGSNNIIIGDSAQLSTTSANNQIILGNSKISSLRAQVTSITALSDRRDKTDIIPIGEGLAFLKKINPVSFTWNTRDKAKVGIKSAGFIAQELLALQKQSSIGDNLDLVSQDNPEKLEARYGNLLPVIVKAIQEESAEKDKEIKALKERLNALEKRLNQLIKKKK
ncbi:MAG: tail fiber domain-containing protein [Bacteroidetes bacterium]|nr:tail fiber domain-containing protein [Bacteroidota bacterium]